MRLATLLPLLAAAWLAAPSSAQVSVGDTPAYDFRESPVNGMGLTGLGGLRGKPVLVEFWGTR